MARFRNFGGSDGGQLGWNMKTALNVMVAASEEEEKAGKLYCWAQQHLKVHQSINRALAIGAVISNKVWCRKGKRMDEKSEAIEVVSIKCVRKVCEQSSTNTTTSTTRSHRVNKNCLQGRHQKSAPCFFGQRFMASCTLSWPLFFLPTNLWRITQICGCSRSRSLSSFCGRDTCFPLFFLSLSLSMFL